MNISTDKIVGTGLVLALIISICIGNSPELQQNIAIGLIGFMSKKVADSVDELRERGFEPKQPPRDPLKRTRMSDSKAIDNKEATSNVPSFSRPNQTDGDRLS